MSELQLILFVLAGLALLVQIVLGIVAVVFATNGYKVRLGFGWALLAVVFLVAGVLL